MQKLRWCRESLPIIRVDFRKLLVDDSLNFGDILRVGGAERGLPARLLLPLGIRLGFVTGQLGANCLDQKVFDRLPLEGRPGL